MRATSEKTKLENDFFSAVGLTERLEELAQTEILLIALDFDGTLAPEVDEPKKARMLPQARVAIERLLTLPRTRVALVSGRSLEDLVQVAPLPDSVLLVGSHGVELRLDGSQTILDLDDSDHKRIELLREVLEKVALRFDGAWVESKPVGFAFHTRRATANDARRANREALSQSHELFEDLTVRLGKNVIDFSVRTATKGEALLRLKKSVQATAVFYAGDDVTDEDVFAVIGSSDVGLKSGSGKTRASFSVGGPDHVAEVMLSLSLLREKEVRS